MKRFINIILRICEGTKDSINALLRMGIDKEDSSELQKAVCLINTLAFWTAVLVMTVGYFLFLLTGAVLVLSAVLLEVLAFSGVIMLNRYRKHRLAARFILLIHCALAIYFGTILGNVMQPELLTVVWMAIFLLAFFIGGGYFFYGSRNVKYLGLLLSMIVFVVLQLNDYYRMITPVYIRPEYLNIGKISCCIGMMALMYFVSICIINHNDAFKAENRQLLARLEAANEAKTVWVNEYSHEIRIPLNTLIGMAQIIHSNIDKIADKEIIRDIEELNKAGLLAREIINNILDLAKIEAGKDDPRMEAVQLKDILNRSMSMNRYMTQVKGITIGIDYDHHIPRYILTDQIFLQKIINNLVSNALKFSPDGTGVLITVAILKGCIHFTIRNTGSISPEKVTCMIEAFESERNKTFSGTGLGLSIARKLVEKLGGSLKIQSRDNFVFVSFDIPLQAGIRTAEEKEIGLIRDRLFEGLKVLIMEDDAIFQRVYQRWCDRVGLACLIVNNGIEGIEALQTFTPDFIICDDHMPRMMGIDVLKAIRNMPDKAGIPVFMVTADAFGIGGDRFMKEGAAIQLAKPLRIDDLNAMVLQYVPVNPLKES
ncbi:response regulator [Chitinophaga sp. Mgbs1]|uniref:histidine kinase n=1 Tax=Chitinophaga solisilvae TaxID=1233460 RepID=A0A433W9T0_9BACT|nr:response regulator [Chitinophaga solisilvae]